MNNVIKLVNEQLSLLNKDFKFEYIQQIVPKKLRVRSSITEYEAYVNVIQISTNDKKSLFKFHNTVSKNINKYNKPLSTAQIGYIFRDLFILNVLFDNNDCPVEDNITKSFRITLHKILNDTFKINE